MIRYFVILAALAAVVSCINPATLIQKERRIEPVSVKVVRAGTSADKGTSSYVGTVEASRRAVLTSPGSGTLSALHVRNGQKVNTGSTLAVVESQSLQSAYDVARAALSQAEDGMRRLQQVYERGSVSEVQMVEMRTKLAQARAAEKAAGRALEDCRIKAPFTGFVQDIIPSGIGASVSIAEPLMTIVDISSPEIHFPLPENEYTSVAAGTQVRVDIPALGRSAEGRIIRKDVGASPVSHCYDCVAALSSELSGIMPGMTCKIRLLAGHDGDSREIVIPVTAVRTDMDGRFVWTVEQDGTVGKRHVEVAGYKGTGIIISRGLGPDDLVIVEGAGKVSTGMKVLIRE